MSNTFKYIDNAETNSGQSAAQDFLNDKLSKNKYMDVSNPDNPYSFGEGTTPGGPGYDDQKVVSNQAEIDKWNKDNPNGGGGGSNNLAELGFDADRIKEIQSHAQGASGSQAFGYTSDTEHHFKETEDGTSEGSIEADMRKIGKHLGYEHWGTANPDRIKDWIMEEGEGGEGAPKPEYEMKPIEHSEEIKQAKERVQNYESDVMSGKTSEEIYGKGEAMASDNYNFDATKGAAGIGTSPVSASNQAATDATASFLNNKVSDTKDKYKFRALG